MRIEIAVRHNTLSRNRHHRGVWLFCFAVSAGVGGEVRADAWPTYRHDRVLSGVAQDGVQPPLSAQWVFKPTHAPRPAWLPPAEEIPREHLDNAHHVSVADDTVCFGSTVDNKVYALRAATGEVRWTFFTEGPVRFAPAMWKGRVYVGSDDGWVYCLDGKDGRSIWKYRAGPSDEKVIGNGRMISLWPVRTSVLVDGGIVYFGAGVFPQEGLYVTALNAEDGSVVWRNDTSGDRAHELAFGGFSPQGYLLASDDVLYVPSGRAMPVAFDRKSGRFLYVCSAGGKVGGTWALLEEGELIAGVERSGEPAKVAFEKETGRQKGDVYAWFPGRDMVVTKETSYALTETGLIAIDRAKYSQVTREADNLAREQKELAGKLTTLKRKAAEAKAQDREALNQQVDEIAKKIDELAKKEEPLKASVCRWKCPGEGMWSMILAGDVVAAGGEGTVTLISAKTGEPVWRATVEGTARGLAVAEGRLFVSTDKGLIYCFRQEQAAVGAPTPKEPAPAVSPADSLTTVYEAAAEAITTRTGVRRGWCLVLDGGTGRLARELARRTELSIVCIEKDRQKIDAARRMLDAEGLYGSRVVVESWAMSALPDYFANLVVSDGMIVSGRTGVRSDEVLRVVRPCGGAVFVGQPKTAGTAKAAERDAVVGWIREVAGAEPEVVKEDGFWAKMARGKLKGAGSWTHLYGNPQNTACSDDELVKCPLGVLWFGEPGPEGMVERHARAPSPACINGRLFVEGEEIVMAYDAYNGTFLWRRDIPGAVRVRVDVDGGNLAVSEDGVYVSAGDRCYRLDPATGQTVREYVLPASADGSPRRWAYVACVGKLLLGSAGAPMKSEYASLWKNLVKSGEWKEDFEVPESYKAAWNDLKKKYPTPTPMLRAALHRAGVLWRGNDRFPAWGSEKTPKEARTPNMMASDMFFAIEADTGKVRWVHRGERIAHITAAVGAGTLYLAEGAVPPEQRSAAINERKALIQEKKYEEHQESLLTPDEADVRLVLAIDLEAGNVLWKKPLDLTGCGGDKMGAVVQDSVLLFLGHFSNHDTNFYKQNALAWRRITALDAKNGDVLWSRALNYLRRPVVMGDTIYIEPRACELRTGKIKMRLHPITGQSVQWEYLRPGHCCSVTSASPNALFYRSYNLAMYDVAEDGGITLFGGIRPGCWLNQVAASGLLLMPEASSGCTCSFPIRCSVAFANKGARQPRAWSVFVTQGTLTPAKHFALNLGAPGDMRDDSGSLWFAYPRPKALSGIGYGPYGVRFDLQEKLLEGMGYFCQDFRSTPVEGTDKPWLFASGCAGMVRCEIPLTEQEAKEACRYTVRLGFAAPSGDRAGQRVFDVKLQGRTLLENLDVAQAAGAAGKALQKEFKGVLVQGNLVVEFVPKVPNPTVAQAPIINTIEAIAEEPKEASQ